MVILNLIVVTTSSVNESKAGESSSQVRKLCQKLYISIVNLLSTDIQAQPTKTPLVPAALHNYEPPAKVIGNYTY